MKSIMKFAAIVLFGSIILTSCHKEKADVPQKVEEKITLKQMENPDNPYDKQGRLHNEFLDYTAKIIDIGSTKEMTSEETINLVRGFYASKQMDFGTEQAKGYEELFSSYAKLGYGDGGSATALASSLCKYFPVLCGIFKTCLPTVLLDRINGGTSTGRTLKFIDSVKQIESKILADKDYTDTQRKAFLCFTSVARFSAGYWHNVVEIEKGNSPYYKPVQALAVSDCTTCDVLGGDAAGAAVGVVVGGVGAGPGAAIGSAVVATEKLIRWLW